MFCFTAQQHQHFLLSTGEEVALLLGRKKHWGTKKFSGNLQLNKCQWNYTRINTIFRTELNSPWYLRSIKTRKERGKKNGEVLDQ